jgi:hypothetical protein
MDPAKPIVIALGRNYKGARACPGDRWMPVCKAVLDILKRHFMVVLIDEYLTSQMCHSCHNNLSTSSSLGLVNLVRSTAPTENVMWIVTSMLPRTFWFLEVFLFHVRGWGRPDYLCRPNQHQGQVTVPAAVVPQTAEV